MHTHHHHGTGNVLKWSFGATLAFVALEAIAGIRSGSLALLSDAGHNFTDALALVLAAFAHYLQFKPADDVKTFGYHRAGVIAALLNALSLILIAGVIFWEAWWRLWHPHLVDSNIMLGVALAGLALNGGIMWGLHRDKDRDLNIRAAFIHMFGDAVGALGILGGSLAIRWTGWVWIDPVLSIGIGGLVVWTACDVIRESLNVLLEGLPAGLELAAVVGALRGVEGVMDVHDLHIWSLGSDAHALSCHVLIEDMPPSASDSILRRINELLSNFHIRHTTIQFEHARCALSDTRCSIPVHQHH